MGTKMTRSTYERMVAENLAWLSGMPQCPERVHIEQIVRDSVYRLYDQEAHIDRLRAEIASLKRDVVAATERAEAAERHLEEARAAPTVDTQQDFDAICTALHGRTRVDAALEAIGRLRAHIAGMDGPTVAVVDGPYGRQLTYRYPFDDKPPPIGTELIARPGAALRPADRLALRVQQARDIALKTLAALLDMHGVPIGELAERVQCVIAERNALRDGLERLVQIYEDENDPCERPAWLHELLARSHTKGVSDHEPRGNHGDRDEA